MALAVHAIVPIPENRLRYFGGPGRMLLPGRPTIEAWIEKIPYGQLLTTDRLRQHLTEQFEVEGTCPVTTQKVLKIIANDPTTPVAYWRVVNQKGGLVSAFPGGAEAQAARLRAEGFIIEPQGDRLVVAHFSDYLAHLGASA